MESVAWISKAGDSVVSADRRRLQCLCGHGSLSLNCRTGLHDADGEGCDGKDSSRTESWMDGTEKDDDGDGDDDAGVEDKAVDTSVDRDDDGWRTAWNSPAAGVPVVGSKNDSDHRDLSRTQDSPDDAHHPPSLHLLQLNHPLLPRDDPSD